MSRSAVVGFAAGATAVALAGCGLADVSEPATSPTLIRLSPTPAPSEASAAWVLSPIGVNLRAAPDPAAQRLGTIAWGVQLDVLDRAPGWLKVKAHEGTTVGWVAGDPTLVSTLAVKIADDTPGGYSLLVPADWTVAAGSPARFGNGTEQLTIYLAPKVEQLPALPLRAGVQDRQGGPVEVYGKTAFYTVYRSGAGGFEIALEVALAEGRAMLFDLTGSAPSPEVPLFSQLIASVVVR